MSIEPSSRYELGSGARIFDTEGPVRFLGRFNRASELSAKERFALARKIVDALNVYDTLVKRGIVTDKSTSPPTR